MSAPPTISRYLLVAAAVVLALFALASPSSAQSSKARIHLIHGIPGAKVDVEIDGKIAISNFEYSETEDLSALAGQTLKAVRVKAAGTGDVVIDAGDLALPATGNLTVIAHLDAAGKPALAVFDNDVSTVAAGQGRLVVRHAAAAPAVDVLSGSAVAFAKLANGKEAKADLPAGIVKASVVPSGATSPVVIGPADLPVTEGASLIVYAVGSLDQKSLGVLTETIKGLDGAPSAVHTGNSPVSEPDSSNTAGLVALGLAGVLLAGAGLLHGPALLARIRTR
jgi:Domain of unknown function (DUF4397)